MNCSTYLKPITPFVFVMLLAACGGTDSGTSSSETATPEAPVTSSSSATEAPVKVPVKEEVKEVSAEEALLKRGKIVWFKCRSCHETSVSGPHKVGPNLNGLIGANAGVKEGFTFSDAMVNSGIVWNEETLDGFIEKPASYVKGTKMAFVGISKESDRKALIAYIKENTQAPD